MDLQVYVLLLILFHISKTRLLLVLYDSSIIAIPHTLSKWEKIDERVETARGTASLLEWWLAQADDFDWDRSMNS